MPGDSPYSNIHDTFYARNDDQTLAKSQTLNKI